MKKIILDDGHGYETAGKRSPEWDQGVLIENKFNEDIMFRVNEILTATGVETHILTPETTDISLQERVNRANKYYSENGKDAVLISIHTNAGGGVGFECFTSTGTTKSDDYAAIINNEFKASFPEWKMRGAKEENFYILKKTSCPAVLVELGFMDNQEDYNRLMSDEFRNRLAIALANACIKISKK